MACSKLSNFVNLPPSSIKWITTFIGRLMRSQWDMGWQVSATEHELSSYCACSFTQDTQFGVVTITPHFYSDLSDLCLYRVETAGMKPRSDAWQILSMSLRHPEIQWLNMLSKRSGCNWFMLSKNKPRGTGNSYVHCFTASGSFKVSFSVWSLVTDWDELGASAPSCGPHCVIITWTHVLSLPPLPSSLSLLLVVISHLRHC